MINLLANGKKWMNAQTYNHSAANLYSQHMLLTDYKYFRSRVTCNLLIGKTAHIFSSLVSLLHSLIFTQDAIIY